jgi:hypothetical protein
MRKTLNHRITHRYDGLDIPEAEVIRLLDIATWHNGAVPTFTRPGRGAWETLQRPASLKSSPELGFTAAKLKGVGLWNPRASGGGEFGNKLHDGATDEPVPPLTDVLEYLLTYPHFGIGKDGEYTFAYSAPSPIGGIVHSRAHREYWAAERLIDHGVPSIAPLAVVEYEDLAFQGQPMGAAITLSPGIAPYRIGELLWGSGLSPGSDPAYDKHYAEMREALGIDGDPNDERVRLRVICELARQAGKLIHDFTMSGMYRYSGDWGNFVYSVERAQLFLIDLDSVQDLDALPEQLRPLQAWRDIVSSVYRMLAKFGYPTALDKFTLDNLMTYDPVTAILQGYFADVPVEELRKVSHRLWGYFVPHLFLLKKHKDAIRNEWDGDRRKSYKMDHDLFYVLGMTCLQPLFERTPVGRKYPGALSEKDMWGKAERYLGNRFEYFNYLMGKSVASVR